MKVSLFFSFLFFVSFFFFLSSVPRRRRERASHNTFFTMYFCIVTERRIGIDTSFLNRLENPLKFAAYKNRYSNSSLLTDEQQRLVKESWEALLAIKVTEPNQPPLSGITIFFEYVLCTLSCILSCALSCALLRTLPCALLCMVYALSYVAFPDRLLFVPNFIFQEILCSIVQSKSHSKAVVFYNRIKGTRTSPRKNDGFNCQGMLCNAPKKKIAHNSTVVQ